VFVEIRLQQTNDINHYINAVILFLNIFPMISILIVCRSQTSTDYAPTVRISDIFIENISLSRLDYDRHALFLEHIKNVSTQCSHLY